MTQKVGLNTCKTSGSSSFGGASYPQAILPMGYAMLRKIVRSKLAEVDLSKDMSVCMRLLLVESTYVKPRKNTSPVAHFFCGCICNLLMKKNGRLRTSRSVAKLVMANMSNRNPLSPQFFLASD